MISDIQIVAGPPLDDVNNSIIDGMECEFTIVNDKILSLEGNFISIINALFDEIPIKRKLKGRITGVFSLRCVGLEFDRTKLSPCSKTYGKVQAVFLSLSLSESKDNIYMVYDCYSRQGYIHSIN